MDWVRGRKLGHGSFAAVSLASVRTEISGVPPLMAVKYCGISHSSSLVNEKLILEELQGCPQIIRCFGESFSFDGEENLYNVLLEYAACGSLADKLKKSGDRRLLETDVRGYAMGILNGLDYIHRAGYVHCDIKLQNVLVFPDGEVKIADFGLAKRAVDREMNHSRSEVRGTPLYMSPEMVTGGEQGTPADIWALGCAVAEMLSGDSPWRCSDLAGLLMRIGVGEEVPEIPVHSSEEAKDFLRNCFVKDPGERWTAEMLRRHPFVRNHQTAEKEGTSASASPRCPFDFPDWNQSVECVITSTSSPESSWRLRLREVSSDVSLLVIRKRRRANL